MIYKNKTIKNGEVNNTTISSESSQEKSNMETIEFMVDYRKKKIKVSLEFLETSDSKAEKDFETLLKEIYLREIKSLSMQK